MALHSLYCADVPLRNCSLTHSHAEEHGVTVQADASETQLLAMPSPRRMKYVLATGIASDVPAANRRRHQATDCVSALAQLQLGHQLQCPCHLTAFGGLGRMLVLTTAAEE